METDFHRSQLRAEIERVSYRNDETGWTVLRAKDCTNSEQFTVTGCFLSANPGEIFEMFGAWSKHPQYGEQFKVERSVPLRPTTDDGIIRYLGSGLVKGIGEKTAQKIVGAFGGETFDVLDHEPEKLIRAKILGKKKALAVITAWQGQKSSRDVLLFLNTHGISPLLGTRIMNLYGTDAITVISADPYRLAHDVRGVGFLTADRIAQSIGISPTSIERIRAAIVYQLEQAEEQGHTYLTSEQLTESLCQTLQVPREELYSRMADSLQSLRDKCVIYSEHWSVDNEVTQLAHFRTDLLLCERTIAARLAAQLKLPIHISEEKIDDWLRRYCEAASLVLSPGQIAAVKQAAMSPVFVLTGGPGVGKTTTANAIIRLFKAMGKGVALAAPTGRAAQRLTDVSAVQAKTIHRLLEWNPQERSFRYCESNPLPAQVIIIDEASMLDVRLADALFRAVGPRSQLILIGDVDQLPSVGPGNVLRDILDAGPVPNARLKEIFRQEHTSQIIKSAHAINAGIVPGFANQSSELTTEKGIDCQFLAFEDSDDVLRELKSLMTDIIPRQFGFNPIREVQILTPMNRSSLGTLNLNTMLQEALNPPRTGLGEFKRGGVLLRQGDKVIQSVNNYDLGVFNGDIGFIEAAGVDGGKVLVRYGDRMVGYEEDQILDLKLAYAITIHKSQGSEFPVVIIPLTMQHYVMLQRNLVYTALTRSRKLAIFLGAPKAFATAVRNASSQKRQTTLMQRIRSECLA